MRFELNAKEITALNKILFFLGYDKKSNPPKNHVGVVEHKWGVVEITEEGGVAVTLNEAYVIEVIERAYSCLGNTIKSVVSAGKLIKNSLKEFGVNYNKFTDEIDDKYGDDIRIRVIRLNVKIAGKSILAIEKNFTTGRVMDVCTGHYDFNSADMSDVQRDETIQAIDKLAKDEANWGMVYEEIKSTRQTRACDNLLNIINKYREMDKRNEKVEG